jgi:hypothetical protein
MLRKDGMLEDLFYPHDKTIMTQIQHEIGATKAHYEAIAERIAAQTGLLREILEGLNADKVRIKFGCLKVLRILSEKHPAVLYPYFDQLAKLLDHDNQILQWGAIIIIGNLASVDTCGKIDILLDRYLQPIAGPALITAANTIGGAAKVARAKPYLVNQVVGVLLRVESAKYQTSECRNVALGHVLKALDLVFEHIQDRRPIVDFAHRQRRNRRHAVRERARSFLKKHSL